MVIDTMVFIYSLLSVIKFREKSTIVLKKAHEIIVPDSIRSEIANVVWQWITIKNVPRNAGLKALYMADSLFTEVIKCDLIWFDALNLSIKNSHSVYDTLFIASARYKKTRLITYDSKLLNKFPSDTMSVDNFLDGLNIK